MESRQKPDTLSLLAQRWKCDGDVQSNIAAWKNLPAQPAEFQPIPPDLHPDVVASLHKQGIHNLYSHQLDAWQFIQSGKNTVITTGTSSGKTLCYTLPILQSQINHGATALCIFPTKALAYDQLTSLQKWINGLPQMVQPMAAVYDGDTPAHQRAALRNKVQTLITNPDMLHLGILPHHTIWARFLSQLRYVVLDELHIYRGIFGSHVANVIRRLKRVAEFYGAYPQFILTSATIANPQELAESLVEEPVVSITRDGSPHGPRHFILYNPPIENRELGIRRSYLAETEKLAEYLLQYRVQSILFARTRRTVELILKELHDRNPAERPGVRGYRSGYLPAERREIESGLRSGSVRLAVATNALELGIDIGGMDAVLMAGYPGTIAASRQQAGRAGRGTSPSAAIMVASPAPLDQYLIQHPEFLFENTPEQARINPNNTLILLSHIRCAAFELPFRKGDALGKLQWDALQPFLDYLERTTGELHLNRDQYYWTSDQYPANAISLRSTASTPIMLKVVESDGRPRPIGEVDRNSALWMVHPDAIYLHEARTYRVEDLDLENNSALLSPVQVDYFTEPINQEQVDPINTFDEHLVPGGSRATGEILVTRRTTAYRRVHWLTRRILDATPLELPETTLRTEAYWITLNEHSVQRLRDSNMWTNDPNDYGPDWARQRNLARKRDGFTCQICGQMESGTSHHVHHKIPFRRFASAEEANQLANLVTLCPNCHKKAEGNLRMRSGLAGLEYVLLHLAPLFVMCDINDLGSYAEVQAALGNGLPVVALYDQVPAGIGLASALYSMHETLLREAHSLISNCPCIDGCPSCVGPAGENGEGGKQQTLALLQELMGQNGIIIG